MAWLLTMNNLKIIIFNGCDFIKLKKFIESRMTYETFKQRSSSKEFQKGVNFICHEGLVYIRKNKYKINNYNCGIHIKLKKANWFSVIKRESLP